MDLRTNLISSCNQVKLFACWSHHIKVVFEQENVIETSQNVVCHMLHFRFFLDLCVRMSQLSSPRQMESRFYATRRRRINHFYYVFLLCMFLLGRVAWSVHFLLGLETGLGALGSSQKENSTIKSDLSTLQG